MPVTVLIPTPLRKLTNEQETLSGSPGTLTALIAELDSQYPGLGGRLTDESGNLRKFVNVYVNEEDVRFLSGKETELKDGDTVSIVPAIAGGV
jgi:molybdopterin synthase sulfur carrier subunit